MTTREREEASGPDADEHDPFARSLEDFIARGTARSVAIREALEAADRETEALPPSARAAAAADDAMVAEVASSKSFQSRLQAVQHHLEELERHGAFVSQPLKPGNEFPTLFCRLPIFRPTRRTKQARMQDEDNTVVFDSPFGSGRRWGPPLTTRDEDTLMALLRLRWRRLYGKPSELPGAIGDQYVTGDNGRLSVHAVVCSIDQVNRELGLTSNGGMNFVHTLQSVKRLGACRLELNLRSHDRYLGGVTTGRMISLIEPQWQLYETHGLLVVTIPPAIATWLDSEYTYLDWSVRKKLLPLGKALHRFLSSQPRVHRSAVSRLSAAIGYDGPSKNVRPRWSKALDQLVVVGWLEQYDFIGTGRRTELELSTVRTKGKSRR